MTPEKTNNDDVEVAQVSQPPRKRTAKKATKFRLSRLALKELRETLRDKRTIVTLILMPLLVYPALSLVFKTFLLSNVGLLSNGEPIELTIAFAGEGDQETISSSLHRFVNTSMMIAQFEEEKKEAEASKHEDEGRDVVGGKNGEGENETVALSSNSGLFVEFDKHKFIPIPPNEEFTLMGFVESNGADVGIEISVAKDKPWKIGEYNIVSRDDSISQAAANLLATKIDKVNRFSLKQRLRNFNIPTEPAVDLVETSVGENTEPEAMPLASLIPLILVLMTITGAVYPAIDLTAGERERGTLETLMAAPVPRFGILFSKFLAVLTVAVLTAMLNLVGMVATIWAFQLDKQFGGGAFSFWTVFQIFLLLILFAAFFSSLLLAVTSFAKSFKEAQVYLIPIILLSLGPGLMAMAPGMHLDGIYSVTPMVNIILLARDVIQGQVEIVPATIAVVTTLLYAYLALLLAARIFGSDSILYSGGESFAEMLQRPSKVNRTVPFVATIFCLAMLFPINFASIGFIGRMSGDSAASVGVRFLTMGLFTFLAFMVFPWLVAKHQNANIKTAFGLNTPKPVFLLAGLLLGISMWPIVMYLISSWHDVYGVMFGEAERDAWHKRLVETTSDQVSRVRLVSPVIVALCLSIIPAVCEEWFFRGMLLRALVKNGKVWKAILISALLFGSFHVLSNSVIAIDRLIPTTLIGAMLGYLAWKSNSIWPGVILHALNNAIVVFLAYYQPRFSEFAWFPGEDDPVPISWVVVGVVVALVGTVIVWSAKRKEDDEVLTSNVKPLEAFVQ